MCNRDFCSDRGSLLDTIRVSLRTLLRDPSYTERINAETGERSTVIREYPHQEQDLAFYDTWQTTSVTGKGLSRPLRVPMERINADSGSGQGSILFDTEPQTGIRLVARGPVTPTVGGATGKSGSVGGWDAIMAARAAAGKA